MSGKEIKSINDKEAELISGGKTESKKEEYSIKTGRCYCGHVEDLSGVPLKKMFMNTGMKKEWKCPQCGRNNVEREPRWTHIFK